MATARVSYERLYDGGLPRVCIKTGGAADGMVDVRFGRLPPWAYLLLLAGIVPFLLALLFARETIRGEVPVRRHVVERYHRLGKWAGAGWALVVLGGIGAVIGRPVLLGLAVAGLAVVGTCWFAQAAGWVDARLVPGSPYVELRRVSPEFAAAVEPGPAAS